MKFVLNHLKGDRWIWLVVLMLTLISTLAVYSSTGTLAFKYQDGNTEFYIGKHIMMIAVGLILMYIAHLLDYRYYSPLAKVLLYVSIPLLVLTLLFGTNLNDASRWLTIPGVGISFQTSDLAKLALIMFIARELSKRQENIKSFKSGFLPVIAAVGAVCFLIAIANMSTALMLFGTSCMILLIGRVSAKHIFYVVFVGVTLLSTVIFFGPRRQTYVSRINSFISHENVDKDKSFQSDQAKIAVASGSIFGKGPGNSTQRNFLPHPYSDFIFAIIIEEYGLFGALVLIFLYLLFLFRSVRLVTRAPKAFQALLAAGLSFSLVIQAFSNMAVATGLFPVTGVPLPLVSMGGTSILFTSIAFGVILSVSRHVEEDGQKKLNTEQSA